MEVQLPIIARTVHLMTAPEVARLVTDAAERRGTTLVANLNLHAAYLAEVDDRFARFLDRSHVTLVDGWPILQLARLRGAPAKARHRVGSSDWLRSLLDMDPELDVVAVGGTAAAAAAAARVVNEQSRRLTWHGFDGFSTAAALGKGGAPELRSALECANLVLVGMGMPRQEEWILRHFELLEGKVVANVGGCIDYLSGHQKESPRLLGGLGLEWLYRLVNDPRRLAGRYLIEPIKLAWILGARSARRRTRGRQGEAA